MKPVLRSNQKFSFPLKAAVLLAFIAALAAFYFSLKYAGNAKRAFPDLHESAAILSPECSSLGGFYNTAFNIKLSTANPHAKIYYTTDGSEPTLASQLYGKSIIISDRSGNRNYLSAIPTSPRWKPPFDNVFKGTILRAVAVDENNSKSKELVRSFFIDEKGRSCYTLPVISIIINEKDFFGYNKGIYVLGKTYTDKDNYIRKDIPLDLPWWEYPSNYLMRGNDAERPAHIELYQTDNRLGFEANVGIRINGNATRGFAQKSLRICFREKYGSAALNYELFPGNPVKRFNSFILRNSGNDWDKTMFRDGFMQSLMKGSNLEIQDDRPAIVFINGEYWGIHNIRERFDENYLANKYHIAADSLTLLELNGKLVRGDKRDEEKFAALLTFVKSNDLSKDENYNHVIGQINEKSFIDFLIANIYFCNSDWPNNNVKFWRYTALSTADSLQCDGRWRWMLYDTDWGFGYNSMSQPESNLLSKATTTGSVGILFTALIKNKTFLAAFLNRFQYHLDHTFYVPAVLEKIEQYQSTLEPEIQGQIDRWRAITSYRQWVADVAVLKSFAQRRPAFQAAQLNAFFHLQGQQQITLRK